MKKIVTCSQMKALDAYTIGEMGVPSLVLMERASLKVVEEMEKEFAKKENAEHILVVCGNGNNGGDGIAIARILHLHGYHVEIFMAGNPDHMTEETAAQWKIAMNYSVPAVNNPKWDEYTTIVDAMFGVGLSRPIEGTCKKMIHAINRTDAWKVAVDIPSGIDGNNGLVLGTAFEADMTVTFAFRKRGLCLYPGRMYAGKILVADIGIYENSMMLINGAHMEKEDLADFSWRFSDGNKGTFGKVLIVAGSEGMCGAACLAALGAFSAGVGMVKIQTVEANRVPLQTMLPEAILSCSFTETEMERNMDWCDVLVIGPGIGVTEEIAETVVWYLSMAKEQGKYVILDADGLNCLAEHTTDPTRFLHHHVILTPHPGEMSRLCKKSIPEIRCSLVRTAVHYAEMSGAVCVLKDACTVIADDEDHVYLNLTGNSGMATAGSGDVLAGVLAGIYCMNLHRDRKDSIQMAALGVMLHGMAGDLAAKEIGEHGMKASDIARAVSEILRQTSTREQIHLR